MFRSKKIEFQSIRLTADNAPVLFKGGLDSASPWQGRHQVVFSLAHGDFRTNIGSKSQEALNRIGTKSDLNEITEKEKTVLALDLKNNDVSFYESCQRYAKRKGYTQDIVEEFPAWAFVKYKEGSKALVSQLFIDFLRGTLGASESGRSLRLELKRACGNEVEYEAAEAEGALADEAMIRAEFWEQVPEKNRDILKLYFVEGLTKKEIGETLGVTEARISQRMNQALKELKLIFSGAE